jgi:hypothetical protein
MRHIIPYEDNSQAFGISSPTYTDLIINEAAILNRAESMIPSDILLEMEMNLLLEKGFKEVDKYHRGLVKGKNTLIEGMKGVKGKVIPKADMRKIEETFNSIISELKSSRLNEDEAATLDASKVVKTDSKEVESDIGDVDNIMKNIENTKNLSMSSEDSGGLIGILGNLVSALTEGGSFFGILHLCLDIVGLVGDFFGPYGMIADIINGLIYAGRAIAGDHSKWILALISFAAAVIPFAGNIMKGMFQTSKAGKSVMKVTTDYMGKLEKHTTKSGATYYKDTSKVGGSTYISDDAADLLIKAAPASTDSLKYVAKASKKSLPLVKQMLDGFFKDFLGMIVGWVPLIGKPLKKFFASIADMFDIFFKKSTKFADDVPKIITKQEVKMVDEFFEAAAGKSTSIVRKGDKLVVLDSGGAFMKELDGSILKGSDFLKSRYGPEIADDISKAYLKRTGGNVLGFYESLAKNMETVSGKYGTLFNVAGAAFSFSANLTWFIGKQVAKLLLGFDHSKLSSTEIEAIGALTFHEAMQKKRDEELKNNPNASYIVPIIDSIEDDGSFGILNGHLHEQGKRFGAPDIGVVAYAANRHKDSLDEDVRNFFDFAYENRQDEADRIEKQLTPKKGKYKIENAYESTNFKHILKFKL